MTAIDDLPNDVALLKRMVVEERQERDQLLAKIKEEAARQLEAQAERHAAECVRSAKCIFILVV